MRFMYDRGPLSPPMTMVSIAFTMTPSSQIHPEHQRLRETVRRWTRERHPAGYLYRRGRYAYMREDATPLGDATLGAVAPAEVEACLAELRAFFGERPVNLWLDDSDVMAQLTQALLRHGCYPDFEASYLVHYPDHLPPNPDGAVQTRVGTADDIETFVRVKRKAFMATERETDPGHLQAEVARRRQECAGPGRFMLAEVDGETAGVISWLEDGPDCFINLVATRVPFRRQGMAGQLVDAMLRHCYADGKRGVIVVPEPAVTKLYLARGFTDIVSWRRAYRLPSPDRQRHARGHAPRTL